MTDKQTLKLALEAHQAMREWIDAVPDDTVLPTMPGCDGDWLDTVEANLKQALATPVQKPVAYINQNGVIHEAGYEWAPANTLTALYTTPPAQEFVCSTGLCHYKPAAQPAVPLTDGQIEALACKHLDVGDGPGATHFVTGEIEFARAIEAKLKEKNGV